MCYSVGIKGDELAALDLARATLVRWATEVAPNNTIEYQAIKIVPRRNKLKIREYFDVSGLIICCGAKTQFAIRVNWRPPELIESPAPGKDDLQLCVGLENAEFRFIPWKGVTLPWMTYHQTQKVLAQHAA